MQALFKEMKQYMRFGPEDEAALRALLPHATSHFHRIVDEFYARLSEHEDAVRVLSGPAQLERLKQSLREWLRLLLEGPWDDNYVLRRARIGHMHVRVGLPQRYMFSAMNLIRIALSRIAQDAYTSDDDLRHRTIWALAKILDLELAIMLETYREAHVEKVQQLERRQKISLEHQLALSQARYDEIVETAEALITTFDGQGRILLFNRRCEETTGLSRQAAAGRDFAELFLQAERRGEVAKIRDALLAGHYAGALEDSVPGSRRRVRWRFTTLPGATEQVVCAMGMDVTEEYEMALRTRRAERMAALGTMAAGLAHEIRNPLNAAHLQLSLLQRRLAKSDVDTQGALETARVVASELGRLAGLVQEFLLFAKPPPLRLSTGDLRATCESVLELVKPEAEQSAVDLALEPGSPAPAAIDDERMKQVILNLVRNAVEAAGKGGHVRLKVDGRDGEVQLSVQDDGPGLPSPDAPIFEPFYTTKEGGTGLGLAIVHRIVTDHGGRIRVESQPGRTVFAVHLPSGESRA